MSAEVVGSFGVAVYESMNVWEMGHDAVCPSVQSFLKASCCKLLPIKSHQITKPSLCSRDVCTECGISYISINAVTVVQGAHWTRG